MVSLSTRLRYAVYAVLVLLTVATQAETTATDLPNLSTVTGTTTATPSQTTAASSAASTTSASTGASTTSATAASTVVSSGLLSNAPTISGVVTSVPTLIIPDLSAAPFMQKSSLPEGTVFIVVGAVLAALGACVLAWRLIVAWSINRSAQRAASQFSNEKSRLGMGGYTSTYTDTNMSMEALTSMNTAYTGTRDRSTQRYSTLPKPNTKGQKRTPTTSSLFFSPTAGVGTNTVGNRVSSYLPAGYYASGAAAPAGGNLMAHIGGPSATGYSRMESPGITPPATPGLRPVPGSREPSSEMVRDYLTARPREYPTGQRTPSAVLDSWFDHSTAMK